VSSVGFNSSSTYLYFVRATRMSGVGASSASNQHVQVQTVSGRIGIKGKTKYVLNPVNLPTLGDLPPEEVYFGQTAVMQAVRRKLEKVANTDVPLLIQGENGTGKEVLAQLVHARSVWSKGAFVKVNAAAIPGPLMESELFGYEKGAFTGANTSKAGRVELADGGTLFLDEIAELDLGLQAKLLQFLQDGHFSRIGGQEEKHVQTRIICATGRQLEQEIDAGRFRSDLFYRINVIHIKLPPLRDRRGDIPFLANYFVSTFSARFQQTAPKLSREVLHLLQRRVWPGNIRELENCMARCVILGGPDEALGAYHYEEPPVDTGDERIKEDPIPLKRIAEKARREIERDVIMKTLEDFNWNRRKTAEALKISYRTLLYKLRELDLPSMRQRKAFGLNGDSAASARVSTD
jgi:two-component system, NtrC family, response regulator AtoC